MRRTKSSKRVEQWEDVFKEAMKLPGVSQALEVHARARKAIEARDAVDNAEPRQCAYAASNTCDSSVVLEV